MKYALFFLSVILLASCGGDKGNMTFENDFDRLADWNYTNPMMKTGDAHSGIYYCALDSTNDYSIAFSRHLRDFPTRNLTSVNISGWVRTKVAESRGTLIVTVDSTGGAVKYAGFPVKNFVKATNQWTEVKGTLDLPSNLRPDFVLKVYLFNVGKESIDVDDIKIGVE